MCMLQVRERERRRWRPCGRRSGDAGARRFLRLAQRHKTSSVTRIRVDRKEFILLSRETRRLRLSRMSSRRGGRKNPHRGGLLSPDACPHAPHAPARPVRSALCAAHRRTVPLARKTRHSSAHAFRIQVAALNMFSALNSSRQDGHTDCLLAESHPVRTVQHV